MEQIINTLASLVSQKIVVGSIVALFFILLYFSLDIILYLCKKNFGTINVYLVRFTKKEGGPHSLQLRQLKYRIPLGPTLRNRFLFWKLIWFSLKSSPRDPVLRLGRRPHALLTPIRGVVLGICANNEIKRSAGWKYKELSCQLALVYDRSEDKMTHTIKAIIMEKEDLDVFDEYLKDPPNTESSFGLVCHIAQAYKERPQDLLRVVLTAA